MRRVALLVLTSLCLALGSLGVPRTASAQQLPSAEGATVLETAVTSFDGTQIALRLSTRPRPTGRSR
jgi:hypothetical protein